MKTNTDQKTKAGLLNRSEPLSPANRKPINFIRRQMNRSPDTGKLLSLLKADAPTFFELAEVVGKWVWVQFAKKQPARITRLLAELGFHWNSSRQARQHPCGLFRDKALPSDPRQKYGSYFPADVRPNLRPL